MDKNAVIDRLNCHRPELEALGIDHLFIFGSLARGDQSSSSDIDLLAEFNPSTRVGFAIVGIQRRLEEILDRPVDLLRAPVTKPRLRNVIESEKIRAF